MCEFTLLGKFAIKIYWKNTIFSDRNTWINLVARVVCHELLKYQGLQRWFVMCIELGFGCSSHDSLLYKITRRARLVW